MTLAEKALLSSMKNGTESFETVRKTPSKLPRGSRASPTHPALRSPVR